MNVGEKANYVRQRLRGPTRNHRCHWPGCTTMVPPAQWGCRTHWYSLPGSIRRKIWNAFRPGQEVTKTPSRLYIAAAKEAQDWIRKWQERENQRRG